MKTLSNKKFFVSVLCSVGLALAVIAVIFFIKAENGVELEINRVNALGCHLVLTNNSFQKIVCGDEYRIEYFNGEKWEKTDVDIVFNDVAYSYGYGEGMSQVIGFDWSMQNGKYRIIKAYTSSGRASSKDLYVEFDYDFSYTAKKSDNELGQYISGEITSLIRKNRSGIVAEITDYYSIEKFVQNMQKAEWHQGTCDNLSEQEELFTIEVNGENPVLYRFYKICGNNADVEVIKDGMTNRYFTDSKRAIAIKSFNEKTYLLHVGAPNAEDIPPEEVSQKAKELLFEGMSENDIKTFKSFIRDFHLYLEYEILDGIEGDLKEKQGLQWNGLLNPEEKFEKYERAYCYDENGELYLPEIKSLSSYTDDLAEMAANFKNQSAVSELEEAVFLLKNAAENRDIEKLFEAHEIIHDYDFAIANAPISYKDEYWIDDGAIKVYFATSELLK